MVEYLIETFVSRAAADGVELVVARARRAADDARRDGREVELVRTIFVPEDETCFYVYRAGSIDDVRDAARRADLPSDRVVRAVTSSEPDAPDS
jgi:Protein of unknown function (DUF4242)